VTAAVAAEVTGKPDSVPLRFDHNYDRNNKGFDVVDTVKSVQKKYWKLD
jgi:hypothetical protein